MQLKYFWRLSSKSGHSMRICFSVIRQAQYPILNSILSTPTSLTSFRLFRNRGHHKISTSQISCQCIYKCILIISLSQSKYLMHLYSTSKILDIDLTLTHQGHKDRILKFSWIGHIWLCITVCSGSVVVTSYDFESGFMGAESWLGANIL